MEVDRKKLLCDFFKYFRDNGEANIGMTIEEFVDGFLSTQCDVTPSLPDANPHICPECSWQCGCSDQPCSCCSDTDH